MLKIRLRRGGASHAPFYRIVVSDSLRTPRASTVEQIGHYDPKKNPPAVKIDPERFDYWVSKGAQLPPTGKSIRKKNKEGNWSNSCPVPWWPPPPRSGRH